MARASIHMLGSNKELTIVTDQIVGSGGANGPILMVPIKIDLGKGFEINRRVISRVDVLSVKGELKSTPGEIQCSEGYKILTRNISGQTVYEEYLNFPLTNEVVNKIEKYRIGKVTFWLQIYFQIGLYEEVTLNDGSVRSFMVGTETALGQIQFEIEQSRWVNSILPKLGHLSYKLIEIPLASQVLPAEYGASLAELEEARKYFDLGDYDKAVAHCRSAIDPFKQIKTRELREFVESKSELEWINTVVDSTGDWLDKILKATSGFASKTHHLPSVGHFGRTDAEILMMITTAIIAYVGKIKGKKG